jgi:hypothetical protein
MKMADNTVFVGFSGSVFLLSVGVSGEISIKIGFLLFFYIIFLVQRKSIEQKLCVSAPLRLCEIKFGVSSR